MSDDRHLETGAEEAPMNEVPTEGTSITEAVPQPTPSEEEERTVYQTGEKYIDRQTRQEWEQIDDAFELRRKRRIEEREARIAARKKKERQRKLVTAGILAVIFAICVVFILWSQGILSGHGGSSDHADQTQEASISTEALEETSQEETSAAETSAPETETETEVFDQATEFSGLDTDEEYVDDSDDSGISAADPVSFFSGYDVDASEAPLMEDTEIDSPYAVLVDLDEGTVIAQRDASTVICPASMTKIMTVLVAAEHLVQEDLDDTVTISEEIEDYVYQNGCSVAGFQTGETVTVRDLFYGTILPSGADAALALAEYVAGSQEAFVAMMNDKLEALGLSDTAHFTNCIGLYDEDHYCTTLDMAMILKAAVQDNYCRQILAEHVYTTSLTEQNPEGLTISNWFLRRIEDKESGGTVLCAKTGFVQESGCCAASYMVSDSGKHYICVTVGTYSSWRCIYDHVQIYTDYAN